MNEEEIRRYAKLMKELELTGLEVRHENASIRLERSIACAPVPAAAPLPPVPLAQESENCVSVRSPLVGVFYAAPAENAAPFVRVGDAVQKGQTLCLVEAMKLMNEIPAETDGIIAEICVTNGQMVEYGTELFRIQRVKP